MIVFGLSKEAGVPKESTPSWGEQANWMHEEQKLGFEPGTYCY